MLVPLIIFMVTAPLISTSVIDVPSVGKAADAPDQVIRVELRADHRIFIRALRRAQCRCAKARHHLRSRQEVGNDSVRGSPKPRLLIEHFEFQNGNTNTPVVIFGDKGLPYAEVIKEVLDLLQKAGVQRVGLSVQIDERLIAFLERPLTSRMNQPAAHPQFDLNPPKKVALALLLVLAILAHLVLLRVR
jgi:biopolymer transport protein TolR